MAALDELTDAYAAARADPSFQVELASRRTPEGLASCSSARISITPGRTR
jgi:hypothetical protein